MDSKGPSNASSHSNTGDTLSSFQTDGIVSEQIGFDTGVSGGGIEMMPSTISNILGTKIALLVSGNTGSVLALLHVDTIPRSIMKVDEVTEV